MKSAQLGDVNSVRTAKRAATKKPRRGFARWTATDAHCVRYGRGPWFLHVQLDDNKHKCEPMQRVAEAVARALNDAWFVLPAKRRDGKGR